MVHVIKPLFSRLNSFFFDFFFFPATDRLLQGCIALAVPVDAARQDCCYQGNEPAQLGILILHRYCISFVGCAPFAIHTRVWDPLRIVLDSYIVTVLYVWAAHTGSLLTVCYPKDRTDCIEIPADINPHILLQRLCSTERSAQLWKTKPMQEGGGRNAKDQSIKDHLPHHKNTGYIPISSWFRSNLLASSTSFEKSYRKTPKRIFFFFDRML